MKAIIALILCLGLVLTFSFSFAKNYDEYVEVIRKRYETKEKDKEVLRGWEIGVKEQYKSVLDHLKITFEFFDGYETTEDKIVITGVITTTAYCTRDGFKIRIHQLYAIAVVMTKEKKMEKVLRLAEQGHIIEEGWNGKDV